ncbi:MAG: hypothetical protein ABI681_01090 [Gemmatimonadales bacterium]
MIRRLGVPFVLSAVLLALAGRSSPITGSRGGAAPPGVSLELPWAYVAVSPISRTLDALTLLSGPQSIAVFISATLILVLWMLLRSGPRRVRTSMRWLRALGVLVIITGILEAAAAFAPRPMARLRVSDPEAVRVDFHSHTGASHDVRRSFTAEDNREWHRAGGFDVAFVSDHVRFTGAAAGRAHNPARAGDGTSLLPAVEGRYHRIMSTIMLGLDERDTALLNKRGNLMPGEPSAGRGPTTIVALPNRNLDSVTLQSLDSLPHFVALELVDAAPRGLGQLDREEARLLRIASSLRLTLVAGSNNHGYGRTVAAWNVMTIPGWRGMNPDSVGRLIEAPLRARKPDAVTIVMRSRPRTHGAALAATLPVLGWKIVGSLTWRERFVWLVWIWGATLVSGVLRRRDPAESYR